MIAFMLPLSWRVRRQRSRDRSADKGLVWHSGQTRRGSKFHVEVAQVNPSVPEVSLLRLWFFLRFFGASIHGGFCHFSCGWFCRFSLMAAQHAGDGVTEQHAAGHAECGLRRAGEETNLHP